MTTLWQLKKGSAAWNSFVRYVVRCGIVFLKHMQVPLISCAVSGKCNVWHCCKFVFLYVQLADTHQEGYSGLSLVVTVSSPTALDSIPLDELKISTTTSVRVTDT